MHLTIKGSAGRVFDVEVADEATVLELKQAIETKDSACQAGSIRLIYSGKILTDANTLQSYGIQDGHAIHMVVARAHAPARPAAQPAATELPTPPPQPATAPLPNMGMPGMGAPGMGMPGMEMFAGMDFGALMNNPMTQQMMQQMADNPQMFADMMRMNPMFANNPMVQQLANNPEMLREQIRAVQGMMGQPGAAAQPQPQAQPTPGAQPGMPGMGAPGMGFPGLPPGMDLAAVMNNPMTQQMMQQMADNPQMFADMVRMNPMLANNPMFQQLAENPEMVREQIRMAQQMMGMGAGTGTAPPPPQPQAQAPQYAAFQNRELLTRLLGAEPTQAQLQSIAASADLRNGLSSLARGAQTMRRAGLPVLGDVANIDAVLQAIVAPAAAPAAPAWQAPTYQAPPAYQAPFVPPPAPAPAAPQVPQMTPEQRFGPQLTQMNEMGFMDNQRNVEALIATNGNVNVAIEWLLTH